MIIINIDKEKLKKATSLILEAIGEDEQREGLVGTPRRVADMYEQMFAGIYDDPTRYLSTTFDEQHEEMVIVNNISFFSMCEHHLLPFYGKAHVGYTPHGKVVGISKLVRLVEGFARRPQLQERLTKQIADSITEALNPFGVAVVIQAEHTCMAMRGVQKPGSSIITSAMRGSFRKNEAQRAEFMSLIKNGK